MSALPINLARAGFKADGDITSPNKRREAIRNVLRRHRSHRHTRQFQLMVRPCQGHEDLPGCNKQRQERADYFQRPAQRAARSQRRVQGSTVPRDLIAPFQPLIVKTVLNRWLDDGKIRRQVKVARCVERMVADMQYFASGIIRLR